MWKSLIVVHKTQFGLFVDLLGSLRARFDLSQGPSTPSRIAVQFACNGATISRLNFELKSQEYKLSLVKKRVSTGKFKFNVFRGILKAPLTHHSYHRPLS